MKSSTMFVCQECGYETSQWLGKCPECGNWNSLREFKEARSKKREARSESKRDLKPKKLAEITTSVKERLSTGFSEMDGVLGGGIVKGSVILLAGDPGIGKSTLLLQTALNVAQGPVAGFLPVSARSSLTSSNELRAVGSPSTRTTPRLEENSMSSFSCPANDESSAVLYISGEESEEQIKLRAERIVSNKKTNNLLLLSATNTDAIGQIIEEIKPSLVIIDSIQTMESENLEGLAGSVGQVRYAAFSFIKIAKTLNIPIILVGHVTKEGMVAGPMILSHMVDIVLFMEGEKTTGTRILRGLKNRYGPIDEVGIFAMEGNGMREVKNPEEMFVSPSAGSGQVGKNVPGSIITVTMEGTRAFLVEIQALTVFSKLPIPRRVALGIDYKKLELLIAVLQKHCRLPLETMDIFVNVAGGLKISDPSSDLSICLAIFSSFKNLPIPKTVAISEVGLLGELRGASLIEKRIKEAKKLGFRKIITNKDYRSLNEVIKSI